MSRIFGLQCADPTCSVEQHRVQLKDLTVHQDLRETARLRVLCIGAVVTEGMRLAPLAITAGAQAPMNDPHGKWSIAYDGVLYNAAALAAELQGKGHEIPYPTDELVIIHAFMEWGDASLERFQGHFAFALFNSETECLYLVRDLFGSKPLFYAATRGHLWFASELPTLIRRLPDLRLNKRASLEWMLYRHLASDESLFRDVHTLRPGHLLKICRERIEDRAFALPTDYIDQATYERLLAAQQTVVVTEVEAALADSIHDCLIGEAPVGTFCSGGVDSSLITAMTSKSVKNLLAFHASATDAQRFDERRYAEAVARALGVELVCSLIDRQLFQRELCHAIALNGMPLAHIHLVPFLLTVRQAYSCGIRVLLTGDAADDHFGGLWYRHRRQPLLRTATRLFGLLPRRLRNAMGLAASLYGGMPYTLVGNEGVIPNVLSAIDGFARADLRLRLEEAYAFEPHKGRRALLVTMAEDLTDRWDLDRADRLGMAMGVECRAPFIHPAVVRLALNLPVPYRFRRRTDKWLLKQIEAHYIPRKLVYCEKRPWDLPWRDYLAPLAQRSLFRGGFCTDALGLSPKALERFAVDAWDGNVQVFWNLLNLELWGRLFFMREPPDRVESLLTRASEQ